MTSTMSDVELQHVKLLYGPKFKIQAVDIDIVRSTDELHHRCILCITTGGACGTGGKRIKLPNSRGVALYIRS